MRPSALALLLASFCWLLPAITHATCPEDLCLGGDVTYAHFVSPTQLDLSGAGAWSMTTRGDEYDSHFYVYNDSNTTYWIDTVHFRFNPSDRADGQSGVCNWHLYSSWFSDCTVYVCLSDDWDSWCQQLDVDTYAINQLDNWAGFAGFDGLALPANGTLAIDLIYAPAGSGSISPAVTSPSETVALFFH